MMENGWTEFEAALSSALQALGLDVPADLRRRMFSHLERVVEANRHFNLTRITSPADAAVKHYADSLSLLATDWVAADRALRVLDVGTGAGFPAVPLAMVCRNWHVTAIDGTGKKVRFVSEAATTLELPNLLARHARAADLVRQGGAVFDLVVIRAVGKVGELLPEMLPLARSTGMIVFYKTPEMSEEERAEAAKVAGQLRLQADTRRVNLPAGDAVLARELVRYRRACA